MVTRGFTGRHQRDHNLENPTPTTYSSTHSEGACVRLQLLELAAQIGGIGIFESAVDCKLIRLSPELCGILGLPEGTEIALADAAHLIDARDRRAVKRSVRAAIKSPDRDNWSSTHRIVRTDGTVRWICVHGRLIYRTVGKHRKTLRLHGAVTDITYLKETELAMRDSELRLRLALDVAQLGAFEADIAGDKFSIDERGARLLGLPERTRVLTTDEVRRCLPFEDLCASDAKADRLTNYHADYHRESLRSMADGSERWLDVRAAVRSNRVFGVSLDVTERKRAEAALRDSEVRLRIATTGAALAVFQWDTSDDNATWGNDRMYEILGRTPEEGPVSEQQLMKIYLHPDDVRKFEQGLKQAPTSRRG
jgi:PAS domain-containing protein